MSTITVRLEAEIEMPGMSVTEAVQYARESPGEAIEWLLSESKSKLFINGEEVEDV